MKKVDFLLWPLLLISLMLVTGCTKEDGATPDDNDPRNSYLGSWNVSETWTKLSYEVTVTADPNSTDGVFITNFGNIGTGYPPAGASVSGSEIVLDPDQVIGDGITVNGSGYLAGGKITWNYTMNDGATLIQAIAVYSKP